MFRLSALLFFSAISACAHAQSSAFVSVAAEPTNHAWYLRAEYHPFSKAVRGIPVKLLSKNWCYANEFRPELFPAEYLRDISYGTGYSFSLEGYFGQRKKLQALVGAFETCEKQKGLFLLIFEQYGKVKIIRFLEQYPLQKSLAILRSTKHETIELWWCTECDNYQELEWNAKQRKFVWHVEVDEEEAQPGVQEGLADKHRLAP